VRGEESGRRVMRRFTLGTPPRARGREEHIAVAARDLGNTPACAGKSVLHERPQRRRREHPRVRGEEWMDTMRMPTLPGTPPRARGRASRNAARCTNSGNTPACAGKRTHRCPTHHPPGEHPRVRGEEVMAWVTSRMITGTPPRARGRARYLSSTNGPHGNRKMSTWVSQFL
jgi:hypothetical protein